jgi:hypothetical protein
LDKINMKNNKFLLAALAGTVTFLLTGFLVFGKLLKGFFETHSGLSPDVMAQVFRGGPNVGAMVVGQVALGLLYATVLVWGGFTSATSGAKAGVILGLLTAASFDFIVMLGVTNIQTVTSTLVDVFANGVVGALGGAVIGMVLAKGVSKNKG